MDKMIALLLANSFNDINWNFNSLTPIEKYIVKNKENFDGLKDLVISTIRIHHNPESLFYKYEAYDDSVEFLIDGIVNQSSGNS